MRRLFLLFLLLPSLAEARALCPQSVTTVEINQCLNVKLERAVNELDSNLDLIRIRYADDPVLLKLIEQAQHNWEAYRKKQCQSVFQLYEGGSIQSLMTVSCAIQLARERNSLLRQTYLEER
jgi:uncharacterized protein YecT (DUF1311 family)